MNIFGVGLPELFFILILGFLVLGPERLPQIARSIGHLVARIMAWQELSPEARMFQSIQQDFQREIEEVRSELVRAKQQITENATALEQQGKSLIKDVSSLAVDPTKHARDQKRKSSTPIATNRPTQVSNQNGQAAEESVAAETVASDNPDVMTNGEHAETIPTESQTAQQEGGSSTDPTLAELQIQMQKIIHNLDAMQAHFQARGYFDPEWNPRTQIEILMSDMHALQQHLRDQGYIAEDWIPPSHSRYTHHTSA